MGRRAAIVLAVFSIFICVAMGTAEAKKKPKIIETHFLSLDPSDQSPNTKNGVTITVNPGTTSDPKYFVEYLSQTEKDFLGTPKKKRVNIFAGMVVVEVAITNNTGHVLRTTGAAVSLTPGDGGEPVLPFTLVALNEAWAAQGVIGLSEWMKTNKIRLVTLENDVILPGQTLKGVMPFQAKIAGVKTCTLSLLDLVTQSDAAGNPTERTTFTFNFKEVVTQTEEL